MRPLSPDLNPIECLWKDLEMAELECFGHDEWEKLPKERREKLVDSFPRRLEAVIGAK